MAEEVQQASGVRELIARIRDDGVEDLLAVDGRGVEEDVEEGVVDKVPQLGDGLEGQRFEPLVGALGLSVEGGVPVDGEELDAVGLADEVGRLEVLLAEVGRELAEAVHDLESETQRIILSV